MPLSVPPSAGPAGPLSNALTNTLNNALNGGITGTISNATQGATNTVNRAGQGPGNAKQPLPARRSGIPPVGERRYVPNEVVVALPSALSPQALDALARRHGLVRLQTESIGLIGTTFHRWRIADARSVSDVIRALEADGGVRTAQPNYRFTLQQGAATAAAPTPVLQYAVDKLDLAQAHRLATGTTCLIAVIDSGVDSAHPEIAGAIADRFDAVDPSAPPDNHGTAIAGAIAAHAQLTGVAPSARILAIRAFTKSESTTLAILKGIDWAVARGARVINMSFAGPQDPEIARALAAARRKGVLLVAAAGNAGPQSPPLYPAADPNVIAVTATDEDDRLLKVANRGRHIALAARRYRAAGDRRRIPGLIGDFGRGGPCQRDRRAVARAQARTCAGRRAQDPAIDRPGSRAQGPRRSVRSRRCQRLSRRSLAASRRDAGGRFDGAIRPMSGSWPRSRRLNPNGIWRARGDRPGSNAPCRWSNASPRSRSRSRRCGSARP